MKPFVIRPGNWLLAYHPDQLSRSLVPSYTRYSPNWWSFLWLGVEISRAWEETQ